MAPSQVRNKFAARDIREGQKILDSATSKSPGLPFKGWISEDLVGSASKTPFLEGRKKGDIFCRFCSDGVSPRRYICIRTGCMGPLPLKDSSSFSSSSNLIGSSDSNKILLGYNENARLQDPHIPSKKTSFKRGKLLSCSERDKLFKWTTINNQVHSERSVVVKQLDEKPKARFNKKKPAKCTAKTAKIVPECKWCYNKHENRSAKDDCKAFFRDRHHHWSPAHEKLQTKTKVPECHKEVPGSSDPEDRSVLSNSPIQKMVLTKSVKNVPSCAEKNQISNIGDLKARLEEKCPSVEDEKLQYRHVMEPKGNTSNEIFAETGVFVEMPSNNDAIETITLPGAQEKLELALNKGYDKVAVNTVGSTWLHQYINSSSDFVLPNPSSILQAGLTVESPSNGGKYADRKSVLEYQTQEAQHLLDRACLKGGGSFGLLSESDDESDSENVYSELKSVKIKCQVKSGSETETASEVGESAGSETETASENGEMEGTDTAESESGSISVVRDPENNIGGEYVVLKDGLKFNSVEDVKEFVKGYNQEKSSCLVVHKNHVNKLIFACNRARYRPSQSTGAKKNLHYNFSGCKAMIRFTKMACGLINLVSFDEKHNHKLSKPYYKKQNTKLNAVEKETVKLLWSANVKAAKISSLIEEKYGKIITKKVINNLTRSFGKRKTDTEKEKLRGQFKKLKSQGGSCEWTENEEGEITGLFLATKKMKKSIKKVKPPLMQIDATYNIEKSGYSLVGFSYLNPGTNFTETGAIALVESENYENLSFVFSVFKNMVERGDFIFMIDKDFKEINCLLLIFPHCVVLLCHFHVIKYVRGIIATALIEVEEKRSIMSQFKKLVYAHNKEDFVLQNVAFKNSIHDINVRPPGNKLPVPLIDYYERNWESCVHMWASYARKHLVTLGDNTTNRMERTWKTYKTSVEDKFPSVPTPSLLIKHLLKFIDSYHQEKGFIKEKTLRIYDNDVELKNIFETASQILNERACRLMQKVIKSAREKAEKEQLEVVVNEGVKETFNNGNEKIYPTTSVGCTCSFYVNNGMMCKHIYLLRLFMNVDIVSLDVFSSRWRRERETTSSESETDSTDEEEDDVVFIENIKRKGRPKKTTREIIFNRKYSGPDKKKCFPQKDKCAVPPPILSPTKACHSKDKNAVPPPTPSPTTDVIASDTPPSEAEVICIIPGVCGLPNLGNTCFINSVVQCLVATPPIAHFFLEWKNGPVETLLQTFSRLVKQMYSGKNNQILPNVFINSIFYSLPNFEFGKQHDCHEFMETFLQQAELRDVVTDSFEGQLSSTVTCDTCKKSSVKFEKFTNLPLQLEQKEEQYLEDSIDNFFKSENISDAFYCIHCRGIQHATKTLEIRKLPNFLILFLKRFQTEGPASCLRITKNNTNVIIPQSGLIFEESNHELNYDLYATIDHSGSLNRGHYTAKTKHPCTKQWSLFNDSSVKPIHRNDPTFSSAYLLFYRKRGEESGADHHLRTLLPPDHYIAAQWLQTNQALFKKEYLLPFVMEKNLQQLFENMKKFPGDEVNPQDQEMFWFEDKDDLNTFLNEMGLLRVGGAVVNPWTEEGIIETFYRGMDGFVGGEEEYLNPA